jgi:flagellar hook assembly protein FlgD
MGLHLHQIQEYPNPFNPETTIKFALHNEADTRLVIYNVKGQKVKTIVNERKPAGIYNVKWDGKDETGHRVSSGVYLYRLETGKYHLTKKMLMLK